MTHRLAVVTGIPAPYREPIFRKLAERGDLQLKVFYCSRGHGNVAWKTEDAAPGYDREFLWNAAPERCRRLPFLGYANLTLGRRLAAFRPTAALVYGYNQLAHWLAFRYCDKRGIPYFLRADSNLELDNGDSLVNRVRRRMLRRVVAGAAGVLPVGSANRDYWVRYGATEDRTFMAPYAIDNQLIDRLAGRRTPTADGVTRFLFVGRLIPRKGVDLLVAAFNRLVETRPVKLLVVGGGPEEARLRAMQTARAAAATEWAGKAPYAEAVSRYGDADIFVLPSRHEPWGLVVNEAMAAGLPVVAHRGVGAAKDMVHDGRTGVRLDALSEDTLLAAMAGYADDPRRAAAEGAEAKRFVQRWDYDGTIAGIMGALRSRPPVHASSDNGAMRWA